MAKLVQYTLEFPIRTSSKLLYLMISTPEGLSRWFADSVDVKDDIFIFKWEGSEQKAKVVSHKENDFIKFQWLNENKDYVWEMKIQQGSISTEVALIISDFSDPAELDFNQRLMSSQVTLLQRHFQSA
ncbi:MAG: SRPBCC domain-containing protein [Bacteroidetes bacterium]|nr:SRPBCC domain-containing protein [Bacteroidota bacterium]